MEISVWKTFFESLSLGAKSIEQVDVEQGDKRGYRIEQYGCGSRIGISSHDFFGRGEGHLQKNSKRQLQAQYGLRDYQPLEWVAYENYYCKR